MNAQPTDLVRQAQQLSESVTKPITGSRKVHVEGSRPDIRVPMREISQTPTRSESGLTPNPPITVYDTSGPYTDPEVSIDLLRGLSPLRAPWIDARGDTEQLNGPSSLYGRIRAGDETTRGLRFEHHLFAGAGHGFLRQQDGQDGANMAATERAWPMTVAFFRQHLER